MSMATRADTQSPALHVADGHDLIRVHGAREQPDNITQCTRCPSLFTQVPRSMEFSEVRVAPILRPRRSGRLAASALDHEGE